MIGIFPLVAAHKTKWKHASCPAAASGTPNFFLFRRARVRLFPQHQQAECCVTGNLVFKCLPDTASRIQHAHTQTRVPPKELFNFHQFSDCQILTRHCRQPKCLSCECTAGTLQLLSIMCGCKLVACAICCNVKDLGKWPRMALAR